MIRGLMMMMGFYTACDTAKSCTEVGCLNGVTLTIYDYLGEPAEGAYGSLMVHESNYEFDCREGAENDALCEGNTVTIFIDDSALLPDEAVYLYTANLSDAEGASGNGTLVVEESYPNGEECPPTCRNAFLDVEMELAAEPD